MFALLIYQIMVSIIVSSSKRLDINCIWMLPFICQNVISLVVFSHQEKSKCIYECCDVVTLYSWQLDFYVVNFTILTPLSLLISCKLLLLILKYLLSLLLHWNLLTEFSCGTSGIKYMCQFLVEAILHIIHFILSWCMHIQNYIMPMTSWC